MCSKTKPCPLCGNYDYLPARNGLLRCSTCGLIVDRQVWIEGANEAQEEEWFENKPMRESFWSRMFQLWNNRRTWRRIRTLVSPGARVLEIGPGNGSLLLFLRDRGLKVEGCDLSRSICKHIQEVHGIPMHNCPVDEMPDAHSFDAVVMNHGLGLAEAMAASCPVVASDLPYAHDVCENASLYFGPSSPEAIARVVQQALENGKTRERLREAARDRKGLFAYDRIASEIADVIEGSIVSDTR